MEHNAPHKSQRLVLAVYRSVLVFLLCLDLALRTCSALSLRGWRAATASNTRHMKAAVTKLCESAARSLPVALADLLGLRQLRWRGRQARICCYGARAVASVLKGATLASLKPAVKMDLLNMRAYSSSTLHALS